MSSRNPGKLNVLLIVHQFLPRHVAGTEVYAYNLAKELQRCGHTVHVFTTEAYDGEPQSTLRRTEFDGIPISEAVHNDAFATFELSYRDVEKEAQLREVLDAVKPDIVHVQHLHQHSLGYIDILKERGLPIVYTLHEYALMCVHYGWLSRPGYVLCEGPQPADCAVCASCLPEPQSGSYLDAIHERNRFVRRVLAKVDLFLSPSRFLRERFLRERMMQPERILYSDNGMRTEPFGGVERTSSPQLRFGFVGTIAEWKGIHLIVEAFNGLPHEGVECRIWGVLEYFPDYVQELRASSTHPNVRFSGRFDNERVAEILADIDVLMVPSLWYENSPLTIHEAFLARIPVVTADQGGMAEYVQPERNGLHFRLGDALALRRQLQRLIDEPELLGRLREFPEIKDIEADARQMELRYHELLAGRLPRA